MTDKNRKRRNIQVRSVIANIDRLLEELTKPQVAGRVCAIQSELKQLRRVQKSLSVLYGDSKSSVRLPRSYLEARAERIEAARLVSKRDRVQIVQGGAPGGGRKR